jgi:hypothetical protein
MNKIITIIIGILLVFSPALIAQNETRSTSSYGNTFNVGLGIGGYGASYGGYYGYLGRSVPIIHFDYEFDVAKNFTLAPFISIASSSRRYYWGDNNTPKRYYTYRQTVIPIGVKGTYYLDNLLQANSKWDFYVAGSLGFAIINSKWDSDYYGDKTYYKDPSPLFLNLHAGIEYHISNKIGAFVDFSTGVSTLGLAFH